MVQVPFSLYQHLNLLHGSHQLTLYGYGSGGTVYVCDAIFGAGFGSGITAGGM